MLLKGLKWQVESQMPSEEKVLEGIERLNGALEAGLSELFSG